MDIIIDTVEIDADGIRDLFKSDAVGELLLQHAEAQAASCSAEASAYLHSPMNRELYEAETRTLNNTKVAVVHPTTKAAAAINRKYGTLHW